jgi:ElaB/YqjD/DUF883 family membrane-anchored ribosome-binding protein
MAAESGKTQSRKVAEGGGQRSPDQIEAEIESTREELGDTVAELAERADVKKQAKAKVTKAKAKVAAKKDDVKQTASTKKDETVAKAKAAAPESPQEGAQQATQLAQRVGQRASRTAKENPLPAAGIAGFSAGVVVGWIIGRR